tara:strand:- start:167 stop:397 length:231 start_codon:yes stop_codon:yes gene_type:complete
MKLNKFSSQVKICLLIAGQSLDVAQITDKHIHLRDAAADINACEGEVVIEIDGKKTVNHVFFAGGLRDGVKKVVFW